MYVYMYVCMHVCMYVCMCQAVILLTGATGFVGQLVLSDLLRRHHHHHHHHQDLPTIAKIILLCRRKQHKAKHHHHHHTETIIPAAAEEEEEGSIAWRLAHLRQSEAMLGLERSFNELVLPMESDISRPKCGLTGM